VGTQATRCATIEDLAERESCERRRRRTREAQNARRAQDRAEAKAEAERQRKARLAKLTIECVEPGCSAKVPQDGDTLAERQRCPEHRDGFKEHRRKTPPPRVVSRWLRDTDPRLPMMPR
jgi:hypothetical protein